MATRRIMHEFSIPMPGVSVKLSLLVVFFLLFNAALERQRWLPAENLFPGGERWHGLSPRGLGDRPALL